MHIEEREFLKFLTINQALSENSIRTYLIRFRVFKNWLIANNLPLTKYTVQSFLFEKKHEEKLSSSTVNTYRNMLLHLDTCCKFYGLSYGFTEGTRNLPKVKPEVIYLSEDELRALRTIHIIYKKRNSQDCGDLDDKYSTLVWFLSLTGCRFSEAANLQIKRLDIGNGRAFLVNTKNKESRYIFFNGPIKDVLRRLVEGRSLENLVFTNSKDVKIGNGVFNDDLKRRAKLAGITKDIHVHTLRHTYATLMYRQTRDIAGVSRLLGHKDVRVTIETYVHLVDDDLQVMANKHPLLREFIDKNERFQELMEHAKRLGFNIIESNISGDNMTLNISC